MQVVIHGIHGIKQHQVCFVQEPERYRPARCPHCELKGTLWRHGSYTRKSDRENPADKTLNPVKIQRYFCKACKKTCSALPECICPRRWYIWAIQQVVLEKYLAGQSIYRLSESVLPSRRTISRWKKALELSLEVHRPVLCSRVSQLGRYTEVKSFWQACLQYYSRLSTCFYQLHAAGVNIP